MLECAVKVVQLLLHQKSGDGRLQMTCDALRGRVRAVCCAEPIVYEEVPDLREGTREPLVVLLPAAESPRVLKDQDLPRLQIIRGLQRLFGVRLLHEGDGTLWQ